MSPHLSAVLRDFADDQGRAAAVRAPDADLEAREIVSRVRRRRLARAATVAASAAAVLALGAVTVYGVTRPEPVPPVDSPSPVVSPSPSPSPAAEPEADDGVTRNPLLPAATTIEPGMLAAAPPGSSLVRFRASCGYPCSHPTSPVVLYLVTPTGEHFDVPVADLESLHLVDWRPGTSLALFTRWTDDGSSSASLVIDLDSGEVVGGPFAQDGGYLEAVALGRDDDVFATACTYDGNPCALQRLSYSGELLASIDVSTAPQLLWNSNRTMVLESASHGPRIIRVPELTEIPRPTVPQPPADGICTGIRWYGDNAVLLYCEEPWRGEGTFSGPSIWVAPLNGGAPRRLGSHVADAGGWIYRSWTVGGRVVASEWNRLVEIRSDGRFVPIEFGAEVFDVQGAAGGRLIVSVIGESDWSSSLVQLDPFTGESRVVLEAPAGAYLTYLQVAAIPDAR